VFLGGFSAEALAAVLDHPVADALAELQEASLVARRRSGRYELLDLVRAFALEALDSAREIDSRRSTHRAHYAQMIAPVSAAFSSHGAVSDLAAPLWA
jgi:predicted ATPase